MFRKLLKISVFLGHTLLPAGRVSVVIGGYLLSEGCQA
jgi:hypothetical protein